MLKIEECGLEVVFEVLNERKASVTLGELVKTLAHSIEGVVKDITPVRSGRLRSSIMSEELSPYEYQVVIGNAGTRYAPFVFYGTKPHVIEPKNVTALKFDVNGYTFFARRVFHPGIKTIPLWRHVVDSVRAIFANVAQDVLDRIQRGE